MCKTCCNTIKVFVAFVLLIFFYFAIAPYICAQASAGVMKVFVDAELAKRNIPEAEALLRLKKEGIDVETIPPTEYPAYKDRVMVILDKMEKDKKKNLITNDSIEYAVNTKRTKKDSIRKIDFTKRQRNFSTTDTTKHTKVSTIYGHSLFDNKSLDVYQTLDGAQVPDTYVLGEGDVVHISVFGSSQTNIQQRINVDGFIQPTGLAKIFLKGLTLAQARLVIAKNLSASYLFRNDQLAVTVVTVRTVMVNVFGEVHLTGGFSVSALNSVLNVLSVAGGPTSIGSVRNIQLIRGNTRNSIDLYAFMKDPSAQSKFEIQNNDVIFVPVIQKLVTVEGAVKRPMAYEMLPSEQLVDLIKFAGGVTMDAYPNFVQVQRFIDGEKRLLEWNLSDILSQKIKVELTNGDTIKIKAISKPIENYVEVEGSVYYPGRFDLSANKTISVLLANAKPTFEARTDIIFVERTRSDSTIEHITVPFPNKNIATSDFKLQGWQFYIYFSFLYGK